MAQIIKQRRKIIGKQLNKKPKFKNVWHSRYQSTTGEPKSSMCPSTVIQSCGLEAQIVPCRLYPWKGMMQYMTVFKCLMAFGLDIVLRVDNLCIRICCTLVIALTA